ncbi:MAG: hypothetical protein OXE96_15030 [Gemmatimonadetes bacterium]|nr:hypothetical protein [Gemmatimonadota bacterium]
MTTVGLGRNKREKMMVAAAMTVAHYLDAALKAGIRHNQIETVLAAIVQRSGISEFWITDEQGRIILGSEEMDFAFPTDPDSESQAAPFAALLSGSETVVIQDPAPRELDGRIFQYVGVAGVDSPRIIQVGAAADAA